MVTVPRTHEDVGCRYVANETPGTKQAKLQLLEQLGWKCYSVTWAERCALHSPVPTPAFSQAGSHYLVTC